MNITQTISIIFSLKTQQFIVIVQDNLLVLLCFWIVYTRHSMAWNQFDIWGQIFKWIIYGNKFISAKISFLKCNVIAMDLNLLLIHMFEYSMCYS